VSNRPYWIFGIIAVAAAGFVGYWLTTSPTEVETVRVQQREVVEVYVATGRIEAPRTSDLGVEVAGTVQQVLVEEKEEVDKGAPLINLRAHNAELAVQHAEARVEALRSELQEIQRGPTDAEIRTAQSEVDQFAAQRALAERHLQDTKRLYQEDIVSEWELEQARTSLEEARARHETAKARLERLRERPLPEQVQAARSRLEQARVDLKRAQNDLAETTLRSPFDGLVLAIKTNEGERVTPEQVLIRVADMMNVEVYAEVDEDYFGRLAPGQPATLIFPSMPQETFPATVHRIGPEVASDRGVVGVHLVPEALPENAFPGLTVDTNIEVARLEQALAVPTDAVARDPTGSYVVVVEDGKAVRQAVAIRARGDRWIALEGIEAGTRVVRNAAEITIGQAVAAAGGTPSP
jgi:HlyD family secretion protein